MTSNCNEAEQKCSASGLREQRDEFAGGDRTVIGPARVGRDPSRITQAFFIALMLMSPTVAVAGSAEDANAAVDRWSAAFNTNDPETIAKNYCPDAILLGTVSPVISEGTQGIIKYFTPTKGTGNKNAIDERRTIAINDTSVVVTGFAMAFRMESKHALDGMFIGLDEPTHSLRMGRDRDAALLVVLGPAFVTGQDGDGSPQGGLLQRNHPMALRCRRAGAVHSIKSGHPDKPERRPL